MFAIYYAAHYPEKATNVILLDADIKLHPASPVLLSGVLARHFMLFPSFEHYKAMFKLAPFIDPWDDDMLPFIKEDAQPIWGTIIKSKSLLPDILAAASDVLSTPYNEWRKMVANVACPVLMVEAGRPFMLGQGITEPVHIKTTVSEFKHCQHTVVDGNHITMLFGAAAVQIKNTIENFIIKEPSLVD